MIDPAAFVARLDELGVRFFAGVPDSLLKDLCSHIMRTLPRESHVITANEGAGIGLAIGHHLRTGEPALVYLQNSGFGNTVNPLLSLADEEVYGVPMLVLVGWRGQPGVGDEPQHVKQGRVMEAMIEAMDLPYAVLPHEQQEADACLTEAVRTANERSSPYVVLVEKGTFATAPQPAATDDTAAPQPDGADADVPHGQRPSREEALAALVEAQGDRTLNVSTTGMLSRELFEFRERTGQDASGDFLTVGGMGHASSIAMGIAMRETEREVWCLDGDGAALMHLGTFAVIAHHEAPLFHVVFNNGVHDSVGGQPTSVGSVDLPAVALATGYRRAVATDSLADVPALVAELRAAGGPSLLELRVRPGNRAGIGRPTRTPAEAKDVFMAALGVGRR
jgi:phosphonopyruvate decarboxylase